MKNKIIITLLLVLCFAASNSQDLFRKDVWGTYTWGSPWEDGNFTKESYPLVKGAPIVLKWENLEPENGKFLFDELLGDKLRQADENDFYTMLTVWVGPMSPKWIYDNGVPELEMEKTINPFGRVRTWNFPYYLDEDYKRLFFRMIDNLGEYIMELPKNLRDRIIFVQSAEGSTGDGWPYKGKPLDLQYDITRSEWTPFRLQTWERYRDALTENGKLIIPILTNYDSCTEEEYDWLLNNMPAVGLKNGMFSHGYHISFGQTRLRNWENFKARVKQKNIEFFSRGEQDREWKIYGWSTQNPAQAFYWSGIYATHNGLSMWNIPKDASSGRQYPDAINFFNKYANEHDAAASNIAFCALRKGLDAADTKTYPESKYGKAEMSNVNRYLKIAEEYKAYGAKQGDPEKAAGIIDKSILGDAAETDTVSQAHMTNMGMINRKRQDYNDVGWEILPGNYYRFLEQIEPEQTSLGWWHKGPKESVYSRFARSTNASKGNKMYFDLNDASPIKGKVNVRIVYLDNGTAQWQLNYDARKGEKTAMEVSNTNSGKWLEKTIKLKDALFENGLEKRADLIIKNLSSTEDAIFHIIELEKIQ